MACDDAQPVDLRPLMANFPTGVAIVTALGEESTPWGMTCTSLCSVSLDPAILLVCLRNGSPTLEAVRTSGTFAVNLLREEARPTAELFASGAADRFYRIAWCLPVGCSGPHLPVSSRVVADCTVVSSQVVGDHEVIFGEVVAVTRRSTSAPLLYGMRRYASWPARVINQEGDSDRDP
jgi:flavin reductase (DIM6/NTAB) family NADH-FMN oxidoreductase RutF